MPSDEVLLSRTRRGDTDAYGDLYERYLESVYRYVFYRIGEVREAEDLTETVFLKVWEARHRFKEDRASFRTWLFRVAHNLLVDHHRTSRPTETLPEEGGLPQEAPTPEEEVIVRERAQYLAKHIAALSQQYQEILTLRFINGMSHEEAAEVLGKGVGAVRVLQHRALSALRATMQQGG